jgi:hypothetical protein
MNSHTFRRPAQAGVVAVEFALILVLFLALVFGSIELARAMYLFNTLQESTRRAAIAASNVDYRDNSAKDLVRQQAIFRTSAGKLMLGDPIKDDYLRIDYLASVRNGDGSLTLAPVDPDAFGHCPAHNRVTCMRNPNDSKCIRFVRVRVCDPANANACGPVEYKTLFPFVDLPVKIPTSTTIVPAGPLGYKVGDVPCA